MSAKSDARSDAQIRLLVAQGEELPPEEQERFIELERRRKARSGDWSEAELEQVAVFNALPEGRTRPQAELRRALLGAGDMDKKLSLKEASELLSLPLSDLQGAAEEKSLAVIREGDEVFTSESRLGAMLLSIGEKPQCEFSVLCRLLFVAGFSAGIRAPKQP